VHSYVGIPNGDVDVGRCVVLLLLCVCVCVCACVTCCFAPRPAPFSDMQDINELKSSVEKAKNDTVCACVWWLVVVEGGGGGAWRGGRGRACWAVRAREPPVCLHEMRVLA
jgi:hypothetical protein